ERTEPAGAAGPVAPPPARSGSAPACGLQPAAGGDAACRPRPAAPERTEPAGAAGPVAPPPARSGSAPACGLQPAAG
ncbi:hypothetical protein BMR86_25870, partial [Stenotrophomonas sp. KAs 5-3]